MIMTQRTLVKIIVSISFKKGSMGFHLWQTCAKLTHEGLSRTKRATRAKTSNRQIKTAIPQITMFLWFLWVMSTQIQSISYPSRCASSSENTAVKMEKSRIISKQGPLRKGQMIWDSSHLMERHNKTSRILLSSHSQIKKRSVTVEKFFHQSKTSWIMQMTANRISSWTSCKTCKNLYQKSTKVNQECVRQKYWIRCANRSFFLAPWKNLVIKMMMMRQVSWAPQRWTVHRLIQKLRPETMQVWRQRTKKRFRQLLPRQSNSHADQNLCSIDMYLKATTSSKQPKNFTLAIVNSQSLFSSKAIHQLKVHRLIKP